ncbi:MAG: FtsX-like permease family protein [Clostridium sp.]|uniref:ABC transporter permease n=1 Tax=Clostridium sp. TaxID=1506 RepID=UPI00304AABE2
MKSFWGIVPRYIIKNKKRVMSIAVGIVLSITLIMSLAIMKESFIKTLIQNQKNWLGAYYDIEINTSDNKDLDKLKEDEVVDDLATILPLGSLKLENTKYSIAIKGYDDNITDFMNVKFKEGRKPNSDNEIALEQWILDYLPNEYNVGDKIKLKYKLEYISKEEAEEVESEFTLVGVFEYKSILTDNSPVANGWVTREFSEKQLKNKKITYGGFINLDPQYSINKGNIILSSNSTYYNIDFKENNEKILLLGGVKTLNIVCYILFVIFGMVVSINIYNVFAVSVMERKKQFGILRALGASPNKIKALVMIEGIIIGIIFIPIGIIVGNTVVKSMMIYLKYETLSSLIVMPKAGVIASVVIGLFAVIIGTYFPSNKAAKVSPMEAINESGNVNLKRDKITVDNFKINGKSIQFSNIMAVINIKRNKKKFITSIISLSMTILLLMSAYYLIKQADPTEKFKKSYGNSDFKITSNNDAGLSVQDIDKLSTVDGVSIISKVKSQVTNIYVDKEMVTSDGLSYLKAKSKKSETQRDAFEKGIYNFDTMLYAYDKSALENIRGKVIEGSIDNFNNEPTLIIAQNLNNHNYTNIKVGDNIELYFEKYGDNGEKIGASSQDFKVGALLDDTKFQISDGRISVSIIISDELATKYLDMNGYHLINMTIDDGVKYEESYNNLKIALGKIREANIKSFKEEYEEIKLQNTQLSFILYSFIFIVAVVSMINLINIMKMNIIMRSKEVGMLRAIGFGCDEIKQMIMVEGILYGVLASILGCTSGTLVTYFIYIISRNSTWTFPIVIILIISTITIIVTTISSMISGRQLFRATIVDSIRSVE